MRSLLPRLATPGWPARLSDGDLVLRPIESSDEQEWSSCRIRNAAWLQRWEATAPPGAETRPSSYRQLVRTLHAKAREGSAMPFVVELDGRLVGQVSVNNIVRGSAQFASVGYWLDQGVAGRGVMPRAVAMVIDHCFTTARLHRIEICVRPENTNSLRVVEKLGLVEVGYAPRFLHIDGAWRDHRIYAITVEELDGSMLARLRAASEQDFRPESQ